MKNKFLICGDYTLIYINRKEGEPFECVIDTEDIKKVESYSWYAHKTKDPSKYYVHARSHEHTNKRVLIHRLVMDMLSYPEKPIDHINRDALDNRKENLRVTTRRENSLNTSVYRKNFSGYSNVSYVKRSNRWLVRFSKKNKPIYLKSFRNKEDAIDDAIRVKKILCRHWKVDEEVDSK